MPERWKSYVKSFQDPQTRHQTLADLSSQISLKALNKDNIQV